MVDGQSVDRIKGESLAQVKDKLKQFWKDQDLQDNSNDFDNEKNFDIGDYDDDVNDDDDDVKLNKQYTEDGYLDAPADNVDNVGRLVDKTDEETNRNSNNYDDNSDTNQNNQNIMDDNNEQAVYENTDGQQPKLEGQKDQDENYNMDEEEDDDDDYTYEEKINRIQADGFTTTMTSDFDDLYDDTDDESDIVDGNVHAADDEDLEDTVVDEEAQFVLTHPKHPINNDAENPLYFNNMYPKIKEGLVEYKMIQNRKSLNTPSSAMLFYTWIILIVLIAVVTFSAFRYRCKAIFTNGSRNYRNGNNGNYRNGEENKKLLENVYT